MLAKPFSALLLAAAFGSAPATVAGVRPDVDQLPVSANATREQLALGDKIFHGEAARGTCFQCHGADGKGTALGNDLTNGSLNWGESFDMIRKTIVNNMKLAPGQDGDLTPEDVTAVTAYVWALVHQERMERQSSR